MATKNEWVTFRSGSTEECDWSFFIGQEVLANGWLEQKFSVCSQPSPQEVEWVNSLPERPTQLDELVALAGDMHRLSGAWPVLFSSSHRQEYLNTLELLRERGRTIWRNLVRTGRINAQGPANEQEALELLEGVKMRFEK